jgi:hypothetical protein
MMRGITDVPCLNIYIGIEEHSTIAGGMKYQLSKNWSPYRIDDDNLYFNGRNLHGR